MTITQASAARGEPDRTSSYMTELAHAVGATHRVDNQPRPRWDLNEFEAHTVLRDGIDSFGASWANERLSEAGALVGSRAFQDDARLANTITPVLHTHDRWGHRLDEVEYHPAYHRILGAAVAHGAHTSAWAQPQPGAQVARAAMFMLFAQIEPGHACPISMTNAAVPTLALAPELSATWMPRVLSTEYAPGLAHTPADVSAPAPGALIGMAMTEKQGGSDVRGNTTRGIHLSGRSYSLTGHKWFCSAPMSDGFFVLAQTHRVSGDEGLSCLFVPRVLSSGKRNVFRLQRLKDKLGNRSNASAEVEFDGTVGQLVGEPGRGVRAIIEMVAGTRLDCVLGTAAGMRQAVAEATWHARGRMAFGRLLIDQPAMTSVLADLALESEAATLTGLRLAAAHEHDASDQERAFRRLATAVSKYWVCKRGAQHAAEALESLGGNGYTESFPLAMRYREQPVMAVWEGSGNVIALDVLRALSREPETIEAFAAELSEVRGASAVLDAHVADTLSLIAALGRDDELAAQSEARRVAEGLALALQGSLMLRHAPSLDAETFIAARIGAQRAFHFGALPRGVDAAAIVARH